MFEEKDLDKTNGESFEVEKSFQVGDGVTLSKKSQYSPSINIRDGFRVREIVTTNVYIIYYLDGYHYDGRNVTVYDASYYQAYEIDHANQPYWYED